MKNCGFLIHTLVALCLIFSGLSPACHFISGKTSFIEICQSDGSLAKVEVPADYDPFSQGEEKPVHHKVKDQCAFCFFHAHTGKNIAALPIQFQKFENLAVLDIWHHETPDVYKISPQNPRGPPVFV